jgi:glycine/D-amino acid oxidase-like deaminating enzyme
MNTESDVIVVGAGHNALTCPAYLAEAGPTVTVLEGRDVIGGNTSVRNSPCRVGDTTRARVRTSSSSPIP